MLELLRREDDGPASCIGPNRSSSSVRVVAWLSSLVEVEATAWEEVVVVFWFDCKCCGGGKGLGDGGGTEEVRSGLEREIFCSSTEELTWILGGVEGVVVRVSIAEKL